MEDLVVRRSITTDAVALKQLVERINDMLISRYQTNDIAELIESSVLSLTAVVGNSENAEPVAIACFKLPDISSPQDHKKLKLCFYCGESQYSADAVRLIFKNLFENQSTCDMIETDASDEAPLETPLAPFFALEDGRHICRREIVTPPLEIRKARIEDYDDLIPLYHADAPELLEQYGEFFLIELIRSEEKHCLVAEGENGLAVGMIAIEPNYDIFEYKEDYDLVVFQDLTKEGIAFRVCMFLMAPEYRAHSRDFMKQVFALMRNSDYLMFFIPTNSPPSPLAPFLTRIPATNHGSQRYNLYLCHRDSLSDMSAKIRKFNSEDYTSLESFVAPLADRVEILTVCNDAPDSVYLFMVNDVIAGVSAFGPSDPIDHTKWDLEEFVDVKHCNTHVNLRFIVVSPLFQRFLPFFLIRTMEILNVKAAYFLNKDRFLPENIGRHFLAIERRQGPAEEELELHIEPKESLHLFPMRWSLQQKLEVTSSIIMVGSTEGVSSFLYKLMSVPYLYFSALHVVCDGGAERIWVNTSSCREYMPDWLQHLHLLNGATHFSSSLSKIDREKSHIELQDGTELFYDYLILLTAKEGEIADMWMAKRFCETTQAPVSVVGDSLVAYYILSHYPGCAHIAHNPRFKLEGTLATIIRDSAVAYCDFKEVPPDLLEILEASSLVYDGGIVIDELFRTNDGKVFASGPITMFSRPYRAKDDGIPISQTEYGRQVGSVILRLVDPTEDFVEPPLIVGSDQAKALVAEKSPKSLPVFSKRRAEMHHLPGNRISFRNGYPATKCRCLETAKNSKILRFFVDAAGFIQAFEYIGERTGKIYDWTKFIGLPAVLLNNMIERFDQKRISDFSEYFAEEWCAAILHDRFRRFFDNLHERLVAKGDYGNPEVMNQIREELMQFLIENADLLPKYFTSENQLTPLDDS